MRKLFPNIDREDGLETILEVPIPEEMFTSMGSNIQVRLANMLKWMKAQSPDNWSQPSVAARVNELCFILYLVGSPLIPLQVQLGHSLHKTVKDSSIQASTAKYIVQQYIAAIGGQQALNVVHSMCITGQVKIIASEFQQTDTTVNVKDTEEMGGFVLWQKDPNLWTLELVLSGCKVVCGSNGKLSWRESSNQQTPIAKGPPRPLRRFLQGLDPRSISNLFIEATCIGEKLVSTEDCFILKVETSPVIREEQSGPNFEIIHHTMWGYFSQRSGLLIQFEDSKLLMMKNKDDNEVYWETRTESIMDDYDYIEGVNIAHSGKTSVTVFRYGEKSANHKRHIEESWKIQGVDFNVWGLSKDYFMPPSNIEKD